MTDFSVLLPVYGGDVPEYFWDAIESVTAQQTLKPSELVIVCDGPVGDGIAAVLNSAEDLAGTVPVTVTRLESNQGLAVALQQGLAACSHEIVARADADDLSLPQRFAVQIPHLVENDLDLLGSAIEEFTFEGPTGRIRRLPLTQQAIKKALPFRDPFNHPSVVYRKSAVAAAGGYEHLNKMEDYWLFARMVHGGARVANLPDVLVQYRVDDGAYVRRGGWEMLKSEIVLQGHFCRIGVTNGVQYLRNVAVRGGYRLVPSRIRRYAYRKRFASVGRTGI